MRDELRLPSRRITAYRAVNSKYPPIDLFDDVAAEDEFEELYRLQARTNPRLLNEVGRLELISRAEIPFGIVGCSYAMASFTHINREGSRFSDGSFGILYLADQIGTALAEVRYHQTQYWSRVEGIEYDRIVLRGLRCEFDQARMIDACALVENDPIYDPDHYGASRQWGRSLRGAGCPGIQYRSVRSRGATCWALMTPRVVRAIVQTSHYEMIWDGQQIAAVNQLSAFP